MDQEQSEGGQEIARVDIWLVMAIAVFPFLFVWVLLSKPYSVAIRLLGFAWLILAVIGLVVMQGRSPAPRAGAPMQPAWQTQRKSIPAQSSTAVLKSDVPPAHANYRAVLAREVTSLKRDGRLELAGDPKSAVKLAAALFVAMGEIYQQGELFTLTDEDKSLRAEYARRASALQAEALPRVRKLQAKLYSRGLWSEDISVSSFGPGSRNIRFTGGLFFANRNIQSIHEDVRGTMETLRFKRADFLAYPGGRGATYTYRPVPDTALVVIRGGHYAVVWDR